MIRVFWALIGFLAYLVQKLCPENNELINQSPDSTNSLLSPNSTNNLFSFWIVAKELQINSIKND